MKPVLITSSILILLTAALRPLLRGRIDPRAQYALWLLAALRLLAPVELAASSFSAMSLVNRAEEKTHLAQAIGQTCVPIAPAPSYEDAYSAVFQEYQSSRPVVTSIASLTSDEEALLSARARELQAKGPTVNQLIADWAGPVRFTGAALTAAWFLLVNLRLRRRLRAALPVEADCPLPVYVTPELPSPCLCGVFRPAVYVTPAALADPGRMRHVLAHELTHYRHRDHWWAWVRCLCLCLYWFDPLVWWAAALSRQDCELACDEGAIRRLGEGERIPYGRTLVAMIAAGRNPLLQTATTMTGSSRRVRERIRLIARRPRTVAAVALALALIVGCAVGCTFTGAPEDVPPPAPSTPPDAAAPDAAGLTVDTLQQRLMDLPEELRDHVEAASEDGSLAVYYFKKPGAELDQAQYLLIVSQRSEEDFQRLHDESHYPAGGSRWFAKGSDRYYLLQWNTSIEYELEDEEAFNAAYRAVSDYAQKTVLETEGVEPCAPNQQTIPEVVDRLLAAPGVELSLAPGGSSRIYVYPFDPNASDNFRSYYLSAFASNFRWEAAPWSTSEGADTLRISASDGSASLTLTDGSFLVTDGNGSCWKGVYGVEDYVASADTTPYEYLRVHLFDNVELSLLRSTTVPNRGQSHEEIAREWTENWEGAMTRTAPGSKYACTCVRVQDVRADLPEFEDTPERTAQEALEAFCEARHMPAEEFGKTWFGFCYKTVFVPVNQAEDNNPLWAGNTWYYEGNDAPEGALTCSRVGYMRLINGNWVCEGVGTGW